jgi:hypothetical protein
MLTSLSINGDVPDADIIVAGFGLVEQDVQVLTVGAGELGSRLRIIEVTREMLRDVDHVAMSDIYPPAVLGRFFVPYAIDDPGARLVTLDSDMIINGSLRPLFELDLGGEFFAAVHDLPRKDDPNYFNSGMTVIDIDGYRYHDIGRRCLKWLGAQPQRPQWPDQDAMNTIVGDSWRRLDRRWNYTHYDWHDPPENEYSSAPVAHFTAHPKPWDDGKHVGRVLYNQYRDNLRARLEGRTYAGPDLARDLIPTCYEILLGRQPENYAVIHQRSLLSARANIRAIVTSAEFRSNAMRWVEEGSPPEAGLFQGAPTIRQRLWAADRLDLHPKTRIAIESVSGWHEFLRLLLQDARFRQAYGLDPDCEDPRSSLSPTEAEDLRVA